MNILRVGLLMAAITALMVTLGRVIGGNGGMIIAFVIAAVMNIGSYWFSDKLVLKMVRAVPLDRNQAPRFFAMVERLVERAELPMPALYLVNDPSPNAFATGRDPHHAAVAVNQGLLDLLDEDEVAGVVAHELAHIKHRDTLTMAIASTMAGAISMLASMGRWALIFGGFGGGDRDRNPLGELLMLLVAPLAAMMIQMAISRTREYEADRLGAQIAGTPLGLADALEKLDRGTARVRTRTDMAHANMYIVNPFNGVGGIVNLFATHPPLDERVRRLRAMR